MFTLLLSSLLILLAAFTIYYWHVTGYRPKSIVSEWLKQGAFPYKVEKAPHDDFYGIKKLIQQYPEAKTFVTSISERPVIYFTAPEDVKEILTNHSLYSKYNKGVSLAKYLTKQGMVNSEGQTWKMHRMIISEAFQYSFFEEMVPVIIKTTKEEIDFTTKKEKVYQMPSTMENITADVVMNIFFGIKRSKRMVGKENTTEVLTMLIKQLFKYSMSPLRQFPGQWVFNFIPDYRETIEKAKAYRNIFQQEIQRRMKQLESETSDASNLKHSDLLGLILKHRMKFNFDPNQTMSDCEIIDNFIVFNIAGKDTTASLIVYSLYNYVRNKEWGQKLQEEIDAFIKSENDITVDVLNNMPVMNAFLNEVLRMYSPVPLLLPRYANKDHYVGKYFVPENALVFVHMVAAHNNPDSYVEPEKFDPSRWSKDSKRDEGFKNNSFAYVPFSAGGRNCIGKHMAQIEAKVILCLILKHFNVKIDPDFKIDVSHIGVGTLPRTPAPFTFVPK